MRKTDYATRWGGKDKWGTLSAFHWVSSKYALLPAKRAMIIALVFETLFRETKQALALRANTELHRNYRPTDSHLSPNHDLCPIRPSQCRTKQRVSPNAGKKCGALCLFSHNIMTSPHSIRKSLLEAIPHSKRKEKSPDKERVVW